MNKEINLNFLRHSEKMYGSVIGLIMMKTLTGMCPFWLQVTSKIN